jgi:drug/metabolite transporter (DMT)-like permease
MVLAIMGASALMGRSLTLSLDNLLGDVLGAITGLFFGLYILTVGRLRARFSAATVMLWSTGFCALMLLPVTLVAGEGFIAGTLAGWLVLFGLALVVQALGQGLIAYALAHLPAAFSSVGLLIEPTVAAMLAWLLFGEALGPVQALGALVILLGVYLCRRGSMTG